MPNGKPATVVLPSGVTLTNRYDAFDRIISQTTTSPADSTGTTVSMQYDSNGNVIVQTDARGNNTTLTYDGFDRPATVTDPLGNVLVNTYDRNNNITERVLHAGSSTGTILSDETRTYDAFGRLQSKTLHDTTSGTTRTWTYALDTEGRTLSQTDPKTGTTSTTYDSLGRAKNQTDALGDVTTTVYDLAGNIQKKILTEQATQSGTTTIGTETDDAYDGDGLPTTEAIVGGTGTIVTQNVYDKLGRIVKKIDGNGNETAMTYDDRNLVLTETECASAPTLSGCTSLATTAYTYDINGNPLTLTDPKGNVTTYQYDGYGRKTQETKPDGTYDMYTYDQYGDVANKTDANGNVITNTYDQYGRLTERDITKGANTKGVSQETYTYDSLGRLTSATTDGHTVSFAYDGYGEVQTETQSGQTVSATYSSGLLSTLTYPDSMTIADSYDSIGRLTNVSKNTTQSGTTSPVATFGYTGLLPTTRTFANGRTDTTSYDPLRRIQAITTPTDPRNYTYDRDNNPTSDGLKNYAYDPLSRLTTVASTTVTNSGATSTLNSAWTYDLQGNRTTETGTIAQNAYTTNNLDEYTNINNQTLTSDSGGNLTTDGTYQYAYDYRNRLVEVDTASGHVLAQYNYDALGRRYQKVVYGWGGSGSTNSGSIVYTNTGSTYT